MKHPPPKFLLWCLRQCCLANRLDDLQGDFLELHEQNKLTKGKFRASLGFFIDCLSLLPLKLFTKNKRYTNSFNLMIRNYIKISYRNLVRDKVYAFINISGLAIGMACAFVIFVHVKLELSFDAFHEKADQIHRVQHVYSFIGAPIGPAMVEEYPGIKETVRVVTWLVDKEVNFPDSRKFYEDVYLADDNFFDVFSFDFIHGNPTTALSNLNGMVITETVANKYFGKTDVIGEVLNFKGFLSGIPHSFKITGVIKDVPYNSQLQFDHIASFDLMKNLPDFNIMDSWINDWVVTYFVLEKGTNVSAIEESYPAFFEEHTGVEFTDPFRLMPLKDVRHNSTYLRSDFIEQGNGNHLKIFGAIAILVLAIACINFMNLATAKSARRMKEVGLRKVMGAVKAQLIFQFITESVMTTIIALILAMGLTWLIVPYLHGAYNIDLRPGFIDLWGHFVWAFGIALVTGVIAGSYPAFYLSSFQAANSLKGIDLRGKSSFFRKTLVIIQLTVSIILIVGTIVVLDQMNFIRNKDLGFNKEQMLVLDFGGRPTVNAKWAIIKEELLSMQGVNGVASTSSVPGDNAPFWGYKFEGQTEEKYGDGWAGYYVGPGFIQELDIELTIGRAFNEEIPTDSNAFVLNEAAVKRAVNEYGPEWSNPIGKTIEYYTTNPGDWQLIKKGKIIGVAKDFHFRSLQNSIEPIILHQSPTNSKILVKVNTKNLSELVTAIEDKWDHWGSVRPFSYQFLDQQFSEYYESEQKFSQLLYLFCGLAITIACLGLFGLASFTAQKRIKEIGVRKVLGASTVEIFRMITSDFFKIIVISFVVAFPVAWIASDNWLENFAYRIDVSWVSFMAAALITALLTLITVSWQSLKASMSNPVDSLRHE